MTKSGGSILKPRRKWKSEHVICLVAGILQVLYVAASVLLEVFDLPLSVVPVVGPVAGRIAGALSPAVMAAIRFWDAVFSAFFRTALTLLTGPVLYVVRYRRYFYYHYFPVWLLQIGLAVFFCLLHKKAREKRESRIRTMLTSR